MGTKKTVLLIAILSLWAAAGCTSAKPVAAYNPDYYWSAPPKEEAAGGSLFASDQAVLGNDEIERILSGQVVLPSRARLAVMKLGRRTSYWSESSAMLDRQAVASMLNELNTSAAIARADVLPSLLAPDRVTVPYLREAAARYQSDLLLIYRVQHTSYEKYRMTRPDQAKARCDAEAVLLDVRSGIVPFTTVVSREIETQKQPDDLTFGETLDNAYRAAEEEVIVEIARRVKAFLEGRQ